MVSSKDRPDYVLSTQLLEYAASIIEEGKLPSSTYSLGGGTVLSYVFNHRKSKDIDIFINDLNTWGHYLHALTNAANGHCLIMRTVTVLRCPLTREKLTSYPLHKLQIFLQRHKQYFVIE